MSAGTGIMHSEFNASASQTCHMLQIWIMPSKRGIPPGYEQKTIDPDSVRNHFARIAAPEPRETEVRLVQDAEIWAAKLDAGVEAIHPLAKGRKAWLQVAKGEVKLDEATLKAGDAAAITDQDTDRGAVADGGQRSAAVRSGLGASPSSLAACWRSLATSRLRAERARARAILRGRG